MKKIVKQSLVVILVIIYMLVMASCSSKGNANEDGDTGSEVGEISIVTTIYPIYDWVSQITQNVENVDVTLLEDTGMDLHNFQPTADDIIKISNCDIFIYVGGESDSWVEDVLNSDIVANTQNDDRVVLNLLDILGDDVKEEEYIVGMEDSHEKEHDEAHEEAEIDEHVWLSLKNAEVFCDEILKNIVKLDSKNSEIYNTNNDNYKKRINALDAMYESVTSKAELNTILVCDRFPFRYLVDDYGLEYYAMFSGCSAESEASFETVVFLSNKIDELGLDTIVTTENPVPKMAETVIENTKNGTSISVVALSSMQSVTSKDVTNGLSYLDIMEQNLEVLKIALHYVE